jgi:LPXTG-site transpeptidase (sortase) family protein
LEPYNSTPFVGGNTVIAGHRFQYLPPSQTTFYHLDRLAGGDKIVIIWQGKEMVYQVYKTFEVTPDQAQVRNPDPANPNILTLYTCSPIGGNARRLIVQARLV